MATTRIKKELRDLAKSPVEGLVVEPSAADMFNWDITIEGPANTPYEVIFYQKLRFSVYEYYFGSFSCLFRVVSSNANANFRQIIRSKLQS